MWYVSGWIDSNIFISNVLEVLGERDVKSITLNFILCYLNGKLQFQAWHCCSSRMALPNPEHPLLCWETKGKDCGLRYEIFTGNSNETSKWTGTAAILIRKVYQKRCSAPDLTTACHPNWSLWHYPAALFTTLVHWMTFTER